MSLADRSAQRLARRLSADTDRRVELTYHGPRRDWWGGWHLRWTDGPTVVAMRALVSTYSRHAEARDTKSPVGRLRYTRDFTETSRSVAFLWFLQHHPGEFAWSTGLLDLAFERAEYPDAAPHIWQQRAMTLIRCGAGNSVDRDAYERLRAHAAAGWVAAIDWLDAVAAQGICDRLTDCEPFRLELGVTTRIFRKNQTKITTCRAETGDQVRGLF